MPQEVKAQDGILRVAMTTDKAWRAIRFDLALVVVQMATMTLLWATGGKLRGAVVGWVFILWGLWSIYRALRAVTLALDVKIQGFHQDTQFTMTVYSPEDSEKLDLGRQVIEEATRER